MDLKTLTCCLLTALTAGLAGCERHETARTAPAEETAPYIVATDPQLACIASRVAPDGIVVHTVAPPDPESHAHAWAPSREDARLLRKAALVVSGGAGADGWLDLLGVRDDRLVRIGTAMREALITVSTSTHSHGPSGVHSHAILAPRPWLDPSLGLLAASEIGDAIVASELASREDIDAKSATIVRPLSDIRDAMTSGADNLLIVSTSEAWRYPARRIGAAISVVDPGTEAVWVRVEITAARASRVVLIGELDRDAIQASLDGTGVEIIGTLSVGDDECAWLDALDDFNRALRGGQ